MAANETDRPAMRIVFRQQRDTLRQTQKQQRDTLSLAQSQVRQSERLKQSQDRESLRVEQQSQRQTLKNSQEAERKQLNKNIKDKMTAFKAEIKQNEIQKTLDIVSSALKTISTALSTITMGQPTITITLDAAASIAAIYQEVTLMEALIDTKNLTAVQSGANTFNLKVLPILTDLGKSNEFDSTEAQDLLGIILSASSRLHGESAPPTTGPTIKRPMTNFSSSKTE